MAKVSVIVPAAGAGKRFGGRQNKIFQRIKGQPVFIRTLEAFTSRDDVVQVQIVVSAEDMAAMKERFGGNLGFMGVSIVQGGATPTQSVGNAWRRSIRRRNWSACMTRCARVFRPWGGRGFQGGNQDRRGDSCVPDSRNAEKSLGGQRHRRAVSAADLWEAHSAGVRTRGAGQGLRRRGGGHRRRGHGRGDRPPGQAWCWAIRETSRSPRRATWPWRRR